MTNRISTILLALLILGLTFGGCKKTDQQEPEPTPEAAKGAQVEPEPAPAPSEGEQLESEPDQEPTPESVEDPKKESEVQAAPAEGDSEGPGEDIAVLETDAGNIVIRFFPDKAPKHVENFKKLCKSGFYERTKFHRCIPNFMIQGGDPNTKSDDRSRWGQGGQHDPGGAKITVPAEFNDVSHKRGIVSMARSTDPDSASSQFFICVVDVTRLDGQYTAFGEVVEGMDVADKIVSAPMAVTTDPRTGRKGPGSLPVEPVMIKKTRIEKRTAGGPAA